jgi:hypothetical protein
MGTLPLCRVSVVRVQRHLAVDVHTHFTTAQPYLLTFGAGAKKDEKSFVGARVIFFVIGGMTYSEVRSAYELTKSNNREVRPHSSPAFILFGCVRVLQRMQRDLASPSFVALRAHPLSPVLQVIVGSTHLYTPKEFLHSLGGLSS